MIPESLPDHSITQFASICLELATLHSCSTKTNGLSWLRLYLTGIGRLGHVQKGIAQRNRTYLKMT